jgi:hypothetical protein
MVGISAEMPGVSSGGLQVAVPQLIAMTNPGVDENG